MYRQLAGLALTDVGGAVIYGQCYDPLLTETYLTSFVPTLYSELVGSICTTNQLHYCPYPCIYRKLGELFIFIVGAETENELFLCDVMSTIVETLTNILGERLSLNGCREQYAALCVALGEIIDGGYYLTDNPKGLHIDEKSIKQTLTNGARFLLDALMN